MKSSEEKLFRWADQLPDALWDDVRSRSPEQAAEAVGAVWNGNLFKVDLIAETFAVDPAAQQITNLNRADHRVDYQTGVVLLTTLAHSKGVPPSGRMAVPQELPGGRMFFTGAHTVANAPIAEAFQNDAEKFVDHALTLGGKRIEGADVALQMPGLPRVPLYLLLWEGDSEVPARAVIGIDDRAHFHLDLSGVFALTNLLVGRLCKDRRK
jgi:hypothetical protein